jgi:hypothetical protein
MFLLYLPFSFRIFLYVLLSVAWTNSGGDDAADGTNTEHNDDTHCLRKLTIYNIDNLTLLIQAQ